VFLKSIELFGFKSFADRSVIEFRDGISAILGPNGCGKSNVVDAIKWVLGEQSTRSLRADHMEDVIFNGTESRKAMGVAEVTLTLSNDDGVLPIEMPEISVKRRLHRSGESEYLINSTPVRLKEVRELFFDTGIGKTAYSIMEQGKIDQILSHRPEERRYLFEEAAGITKYKIRGAEAERKLERTSENMRQVENILREVKRSHDTLKIQSEKTESYRALREKSFELERDIQLLKLKELSAQDREKEERLSGKLAERDELKKSIDQINESLEENLDRVNTMESRLIESQKRLYGIDIEKSNRESRKTILSERIEEFKRQIEAAGVREENIAKKIGSLRESVTEKESQVGVYGRQLKDTDLHIARFEENVENARRRIMRNEDEESRLEAEISRIGDDLQEYRKKLDGLTEDIVTQLDTRLRETGYSYTRRRETEESIVALVEDLKIRIDGKQSLLADAKSTSSDAYRTLLQAVEKTLLGLEEMRTHLLRLSEVFEEYRAAVPSFLDEFLAPEGIITKKREIDAAVQELQRKSVEASREIARMRKENRELGEKMEEYRKTLEELKMNRVQVEMSRKAAVEAKEELIRRIEEQNGLLEDSSRERERNGRNIKDTKEKREEVERERVELAEQEKKLKAELEELEEAITKKNKDLSSKESTLKKRIDQLAKVQDQVEKLQMDVASVKTEIRGLYDSFREQFSKELSDYETRMFDIKEDSQSLRRNLSETKNEIKNLGQVNLMAPEEYAEVKERYEFLSGQLADLQEAREDLEKVTKQIRTESTELFLETYEKIRKNFHSMYRRLFGGGRGELKLTDPDNVLDSGVEIFAQPPGKSLENIALLSGGERSLTAVGLLFATYMVRPSPFCVLDEIDAALDEANVGRFIALLGEFGKYSQFVIITHNKKTVSGAMTLLGVTMEESGVSKIIAVRLADDGRGVNKDEGEPVGVGGDSGLSHGEGN
jgi:chromosome segregation protein